MVKLLQYKFLPFTGLGPDILLLKKDISNHFNQFTSIIFHLILWYILLINQTINITFPEIGLGGWSLNYTILSVMLRWRVSACANYLVYLIYSWLNTEAATAAALLFWLKNKYLVIKRKSSSQRYAKLLFKLWL